MKFFIPSIGDQFITTAPWELDLIHAYNSGFTEFLEEQNPGTFKRESTYDYNFNYEKNASGGWDYDKPKFTTVVLPAGVTLQLNKLDMKISTRSDKHRSSAGDSVTFKITAGLDTKKKLELFVRLTDANKLICEPVVVSERAKVKRIKKPEIIKMLGSILDVHVDGKFNFNSYNKRPEWLTAPMEQELSRAAMWFNKMSGGRQVVRSHEFSRLYGGESTFERSGEGNLVCSRRFAGTVLPLGWRGDSSIDASKTSMHVVTDDDIKITSIRFEGI